ncbi:MAG: rhomboid family intramembrane serine protease [Acidobacteria bacterium]|nr:rhomboid family intramembrane serine protease [Acidobacteriota bacterium]
MFKRQTSGSVICTSCGTLVGVNDAVCYNCNRRNPGLWGYAPAFRRLGQDLGFVPLVMGGTLTLYLVSLLLSGASLRPMLAPSQQALILLGASGSIPVFVLGHWWTVVTAGWLHGGLIHIAFNLYWIRLLAPGVAELYGPGRMVLIYTAAGVVGFTFSSVAGRFLGGLPLIGGGQLTVGASAPIFGLLGALVYYGRRTGSRHVGQTGVQYAIFMGIFGLIGSGIDNQAHLGGFVGGYLASLLLDPLRPERIDHLVGAAACLAITLVAVVASVVTALPLLLN